MDLQPVLPMHFLKEIQPQLGLISVGANNRYGHPDNEVISNCDKLNIDLLMTKGCRNDPYFYF